MSRGEKVAKNKPKPKCSECKKRPVDCPSSDQVDETIELLAKRFPMLAERRRVFVADLDELIAHNCKDLAGGDNVGGQGDLLGGQGGE